MICAASDCVYADMFLVISTERESSVCSADLISAFCDVSQTRCMPHCMLASCMRARCMICVRQCLVSITRMHRRCQY